MSPPPLQASGFLRNATLPLHPTLVRQELAFWRQAAQLGFFSNTFSLRRLSKSTQQALNHPNIGKLFEVTDTQEAVLPCGRKGL